MADRRSGYATLAGAVTVVVVGIGVALSPVASEPPSEPVVVPDLPLSRVRLDEIDAKRTPFCRNISDQAVIDAVGGSATASEYTNGEQTTLEPGLTDVAHEFGCAFTHGETQARVWVFAAPVTPHDAQLMVDDAKDDEGCAEAGVLQFGRPGTVLLCTTPTETVLRAVGRIGDAWAHCELSTPVTGADPRLILRGQHWCVAAAYAMQ
jgi:hypothetical protein